MAAKGKSPVSIETKKAAFALRLQRFTNSQIGERLNLHPVTVSRIFTALKKLEAAGVVPKEQIKPPNDTEVLRGWKERLTVKSVKAIDRGLDDQSDNYKAGGLGHSVLKGLGEFDGDSVNVHINQMINSVPEEFKSRYLVSGDDVDEPAPRVLPAEQHELWALEVFKKSGYSAAEFNQLRRDAQAGRVLVSSDEDFDEFFRAEEARHLNNKDGLPQLPEEK
jgi:hypothetical protein